MNLYTLLLHLSQKAANTKAISDKPAPMAGRCVAAWNSHGVKLIRTSLQHGTPTTGAACPAGQQCCLQPISKKVHLKWLPAACPKGREVGTVELPGGNKQKSRAWQSLGQWTWKVGRWEVSRSLQETCPQMSCLATTSRWLWTMAGFPRWVLATI